PGFVVLRSMKRVRGTWLDPFGKAKVRRLERALIAEYEAAVEQLLAGLTAASMAEAVAIASLPDQVRGYEHIKLAPAAAYRVELTRRLDAYTSAVVQPVS